MKRMLVVAILAAVAALASPGQENLAHAAIVCTGHARQFGNGVVGTLGNDLIDCSASTVGLNIIGLDGDDMLFGGKGDDPLFGANGKDLCDGQEGKGDWASFTCELTVHVP